MQIHRIISSFLFLSALTCAHALEVDSIAAKVGSDTILKSDVFREMRRLNAPAAEYIDVRNEMIDRRLILKSAIEAKVTMQDWVVENHIRDIIKKSFDGDRNKLIEALSRQKMSYTQWCSQLKDDMIVSAMRWNVIDKNIVASPGAMRREFAENPQRYSLGGKVTVSVILLKPEDSSKRDEISSAIKTKSFADLARQYSADSHASEGGVWKDVVAKDVFKEEICEEIAKMPKGTISRWIEIDGWSFLLRKDAETPGRQRSFLEAYDDIAANVKNELSKKAYGEWIERLRSETYIKVF